MITERPTPSVPFRNEQERPGVFPAIENNCNAGFIMKRLSTQSVKITDVSGSVGRDGCRIPYSPQTE
ncbi:hypothetical protein F2P81_001588 [Scophthalmus maximus]|uniref:Uncharacterized protein n=1 Tax=Scophthalmus maximus TaxID=52904 RepID=A0A6A4TJR7_SCOMX|nr:hypothetical protein F2P81_001588 [Scophthalmus maximus]